MLRHLCFVLEPFFTDPGDLTLGGHAPDEELQEGGLDLVKGKDLDGILPELGGTPVHPPFEEWDLLDSLVEVPDDEVGMVECRKHGRCDGLLLSAIHEILGD